jgi:TetR/AcrR family transcriptional regulator, regulator of cefoperazone and chloramphenicol sensitivity
MLPAIRTVPARARPRGGNPRGERTRRRLVETAITVFAELGYEGASTRLLAERAGVTLPAIQYHFGSKEGLYRAAVEHIADFIAQQMAPVGSRVKAALARKHLPRRDLVALLVELLDIFVAMVFESRRRHGRAQSEARKLFIARAEIENVPALEALYDVMRKSVGEPCAALIGRLTNRPARDQATLLRMAALIGQVTVFCNKPALRTLGWQNVTRSRLRAVQTLAREQTRALYRGDGR